MWRKMAERSSFCDRKPPPKTKEFNIQFWHRNYWCWRMWQDPISLTGCVKGVLWCSTHCLKLRKKILLDGLGFCTSPTLRIQAEIWAFCVLHIMQRQINQATSNNNLAAVGSCHPDQICYWWSYRFLRSKHIQAGVITKRFIEIINEETYRFVLFLEKNPG